MIICYIEMLDNCFQVWTTEIFLFLFLWSQGGFVFLFFKILKWFERSEGSCAKFAIISIEVITAFLSLGRRGGSWRLRNSQCSIRKLLAKTKGGVKNFCPWENDESVTFSRGEVHIEDTQRGKSEVSEVGGVLKPPSAYWVSWILDLGGHALRGGCSLSSLGSTGHWGFPESLALGTQFLCLDHFTLA